MRGKSRNLFDANTHTYDTEGEGEGKRIVDIAFRSKLKMRTAIEVMNKKQKIRRTKNVNE